ncbi:hypothetical protein HUS91_19720 [Pseudomonas chlororaphis]|uniref:hypothetical protein n=1 Tax=Pseudomonas TaxID=286 RepID=UPI000F5837CE|nr:MULTISPECIES: hypothetical protein [Pseudomonas]AZC50740.1 hypothetical protein C4K35_3157 [Pseudomonas chlororaphis subsp. piscium]AZC57312.1 hypothetical protein C4K34_3147 [Pseudomonas chlororaphis subsp. piscium]AZC75949.1 hypothetical protein C4K31_3046 [Pseudomonas chlororaphis subsp. piscium]AZC82227.1 hypothetical protein C4K30_3113 [Pseudomonas chlororaphis subsp. piscium]AZC89413.1 hypothetical protein C4K29_3112 [Pseudomonas chlororaphis subsp. piscium]
MPNGKVLYLLAFKELAGASGLLQNDVSVQPLLPGGQLEASSPSIAGEPNEKRAPATAPVFLANGWPPCSR